jgi:hypothetical protein
MTPAGSSDRPVSTRSERVRAQFVGVEFEQLWTITPDTIKEFAGYFGGAPFVDACLLPFVGHDGDHHRAGKALQLRQLAFAVLCGQEVARTDQEATSSA